MSDSSSGPAPLPRLTVRSTAFFAGSMRVAVLADWFADQTLPAPSTATPAGACPTPTCVRSVPSLPRRDTVLLPEFATQTLPSGVTATPRALLPPVVNVPATAPVGDTFCTLLLVPFDCHRK